MDDRGQFALIRGVHRIVAGACVAGLADALEPAGGGDEAPVSFAVLVFAGPASGVGPGCRDVGGQRSGRSGQGRLRRAGSVSDAHRLSDVVAGADWIVGGTPDTADSDWCAVSDTIPQLGVVVILSLLGVLLNISGIQALLRQRVDGQRRVGRVAGSAS